MGTAKIFLKSFSLFLHLGKWNSCLNRKTSLNRTSLNRKFNVLPKRPKKFKNNFKVVLTTICVSASGDLLKIIRLHEGVWPNSLVQRTRWLYAYSVKNKTKTIPKWIWPQYAWVQVVTCWKLLGSIYCTQRQHCFACRCQIEQTRLKQASWLFHEKMHKSV